MRKRTSGARKGSSRSRASAPLAAADTWSARIDGGRDAGRGAAAIAEAAQAVAERAQEGDIIVCLGAGDITAWAYALPRTAGPTALVLSRQKLPVLERMSTGGVSRGAYVVADAEGGAPQAIIIELEEIPETRQERRPPPPPRPVVPSIGMRCRPVSSRRSTTRTSSAVAMRSNQSVEEIPDAGKNGTVDVARVHY